MTPVHQGVHVLRKDVRELRWMIAGYALLTLLIGAASVGGNDTVSMIGFAPLLLILLGMMIAAASVHADAPADPRAFWMSRPLDSSNVVQAKLMLAVLLVFVALVAQCTALLAYRIPAREIPWMLWDSALNYGAWLVAALLLATLTRDLRSFFLLLVAVPVLLFVVTFVLPPTMSEPAPSGMPSWTAFLLILSGSTASLALLGHIYRRREVRRWQRILAPVAITVLILGIGAKIAEPPSTSIRRVLRADIVVNSGLGDGSDELDIRIQLDSGPSSATKLARLMSPVAHVRLRDSSIIRLHTRQASLDLTRPPFPDFRDLRWLAKPEGNPTTVIGFLLSPANRRRLSAGVASVEIVGRVVLLEPAVAAIAPLQDGARLTFRGNRIQVASYVPMAGNASLTVGSRRLERSDDEVEAPRRGVRYALVNLQRGEVMPLYHAGGSGNGGWLLLPGTPLWTSSDRFETQSDPPFNRGPAISDPRWLDEARLAVIEWRPVAAYTAVLTASR